MGDRLGVRLWHPDLVLHWLSGLILDFTRAGHRRAIIALRRFIDGRGRRIVRAGPLVPISGACGGVRLFLVPSGEAGSLTYTF